MASKEGYKTKEDKAHEKKMGKLRKDLVFFKVVNTLPDNTGGQERHETLKQTKAVLEEMKKEKERLEKISEDKERKNKAKKWAVKIWLDVLINKNATFLWIKHHQKNHLSTMFHTI